MLNDPAINEPGLFVIKAKRFSALIAIKFFVKKSACWVAISTVISILSRISAASGEPLPTRKVPTLMLVVTTGTRSNTRGGSDTPTGAPSSLMAGRPTDSCGLPKIYLP